MLETASKQKKVRPQSSNTAQIKERNKGMNGLKNLNSSSDESDAYSIPEDDKEGDEDSNKASAIKEPEKEDSYSEEQYGDRFESTPEGMKKKPEESEEQEIDEEEMIDTAEKIFIRMADHMFNMKMTVRSAFKSHIFAVEVNNEALELIAPMGFLEGLKQLGIDDLEEIEVTYLLKVLSKSELDGAIMVDELLQIMANFGLYDDDEN